MVGTTDDDDAWLGVGGTQQVSYSAAAASCLARSPPPFLRGSADFLLSLSVSSAGILSLSASYIATFFFGLPLRCLSFVRPRVCTWCFHGYRSWAEKKKTMDLTNRALPHGKRGNGMGWRGHKPRGTPSIITGSGFLFGAHLSRSLSLSLSSALDTCHVFFIYLDIIRDFSSCCYTTRSSTSPSSSHMLGLFVICLVIHHLPPQPSSGERVTGGAGPRKRWGLRRDVVAPFCLLMEQPNHK